MVDIEQDTQIGADGLRHPIDEIGEWQDPAPFRRQSVGVRGDRGGSTVAAAGPDGAWTWVPGLYVQADEPGDDDNPPAEDDLWVDTSTSPAVAKQYLTDAWVTLVAPED